MTTFGAFFAQDDFADFGDDDGRNDEVRVFGDDRGKMMRVRALFQAIEPGGGIE